MSLLGKMFEETKAELNQLLIDEKNGCYYSFLMDEEGDLFKIEFLNDDCIKIANPDFTFLTLSSENLETMKDLLEQTNELYNN